MRGSGLTWMSIARISSGWRPSGRFFWTAMRSRMSFFSSASNASCALLAELGVGLGGRVAGVLLEHLLLDGLRRVLALELVLDLRRGVERGAVRLGDLAREVLVDLRHLDLQLRLAGLLGQLALRGAQLLDLRCAMSSASRISASGTSLAPASTIRMASSVPDTTRSRSDSSSCSSVGLMTKLPSSLPIRTAPTGAGNGMSEICSAADAPFMASTSYGVRPGRPTAACRRAASRGASPSGTAAAADGRSCARSASPSRRRDPRA